MSDSGENNDSNMGDDDVNDDVDDDSSESGNEEQSERPTSSGGGSWKPIVLLLVFGGLFYYVSSLGPSASSEWYADNMVSAIVQGDTQKIEKLLATSERYVTRDSTVLERLCSIGGSANREKIERGIGILLKAGASVSDAALENEMCSSETNLGKILRTAQAKQRSNTEL